LENVQEIVENEKLIWEVPDTCVDVHNYSSRNSSDIFGGDTKGDIDLASTPSNRIGASQTW
jgi:hypothetical protein